MEKLRHEQRQQSEEIKNWIQRLDQKVERLHEMAEDVPDLGESLTAREVRPLFAWPKRSSIWLDLLQLARWRMGGGVCLVQRKRSG